MEDVRCPGCGGMIPFPEVEMPVCPRCGQGFDIIDGGGGIWIMGLREPPPKSALTTPHDNDPLVRKYVMWKGIGILILSIGLAGGAILFMDLRTAYENGLYYFGRAHFILAAVSIFLVLTGGGVFLAGWAFKEDRLRSLDNNTEQK